MKLPWLKLGKRYLNPALIQSVVIDAHHAAVWTAGNPEPLSFTAATEEYFAVRDYVGGVL